MRASKKTAQGRSGAHAFSRLPFVSPVRGHVGIRSELLGVLMRWSLRLLPYQLWPNTTRGSTSRPLHARLMVWEIHRTGWERPVSGMKRRDFVTLLGRAVGPHTIDCLRS